MTSQAYIETLQHELDHEMAFAVSTYTQTLLDAQDTLSRHEEYARRNFEAKLKNALYVRPLLDAMGEHATPSIVSSPDEDEVWVRLDVSEFAAPYLDGLLMDFPSKPVIARAGRLIPDDDTSTPLDGDLKLQGVRVYADTKKTGGVLTWDTDIDGRIVHVDVLVHNCLEINGLGTLPQGMKSNVWDSVHHINLSDTNGSSYWERVCDGSQQCLVQVSSSMVSQERYKEVESQRAQVDLEQQATQTFYKVLGQHGLDYNKARPMILMRALTSIALKPDRELITASDLHSWPQPHSNVVMLRHDGELQAFLNAPAVATPAATIAHLAKKLPNLWTLFPNTDGNTVCKVLADAMVATRQHVQGVSYDGLGL